MFLTFKIDLQNYIFILGDFNAHNTIWESKHIDKRGEEIEQFLETANLFLLNTEENTQFNANNRLRSARLNT